MKNVFINESISFESTLASPSKPRQNNIVQKPKQIFLVNFVDDNISLSLNKKNSDTSPGKNPLRKNKSKTKKKTNQNNNSIKNNKNPEFHLLDFDALFKNVIIGKKKSKSKKVHKTSHIGRNKNKIKLIGSKRIRLLSNKNTIKKRKYLSLLFIFIIISIEANIKKKKININTTSKGQSIQNNNTFNRYDIYDINNFCSNTMKIKEKSISHNVIVPSFEELPDDFFEDNNIEVSQYLYYFYYFQDYEDISDNNYLKYHNIFEQKEIDYRIQVSHNLDKKKSKKELKKEIIEAKKAYQNLYSTENIDIADTKNKVNENTNSYLNVIKINLASLELENLE